jgi:hypothetical protein
MDDLGRVLIIQLSVVAKILAKPAPTKIYKFQYGAIASHPYSLQPRYDTLD